MPEDNNLLTDLVKRIRPLLVNISESVANTIINTYITNNGVYDYFAPVLRGWNNTTSAYVDISIITGPAGIIMDNVDNIAGVGYFLTPAGWTGTLTVTGLARTVTHPGAGGPYGYYRNFIQAVDYFDHTSGTPGDNGPSQIDLTGNPGAFKILPVSTTISKQALVRVYCYRFGSHANDTSDYTHYFLGWLLEYS